LTEIVRSLLGNQIHPQHWVAAEDYASMKSGSYQTYSAFNKVLCINGLDVLIMKDAMLTYCSITAPDVIVSLILTGVL